jgi:hypothetical protein
MNADRIEKTLDDLVARTNPGPATKSDVWGAFIFGLLVGAVGIFWYLNRQPRYELHVISPGIIVRLDHKTGAVTWTYVEEKEFWRTVQPSSNP